MHRSNVYNLSSQTKLKVDRFIKDLEDYGFYKPYEVSIVNSGREKWAEAKFKSMKSMKKSTLDTFNLYLNRKDFNIVGEVRDGEYFYTIRRNVENYELPKGLKWIDKVAAALDWLDRETRTTR